MLPLPIDPFIPAIRDALVRARAVIVTAQPGAGKTTRVPPALIEDGPVLLLQPRRAAARAIAARIADERGWRIGGEIGWQIRFSRRFGPGTRLLVATEGILTARLQHDPLLSSFRTIVVDEFQERSLHLDVAIALAKQAWIARGDLRLVVMSATLEAETIAAFLGGCPIVDVPGRVFPLTIEYAPAQSVEDAAVELLTATEGSVLCFLPGAAEIRRAVDAIAPRVARDEVDVLPLHGSLDAAAQDRALQPSPRRRIVVATNVAETSVTVSGVAAVVDTGLQKVARYDADRVIDSLELERITLDSAEQRAGRAGREQPGVVRRLWDARDRLRPHREPELHRVDLSGAVLDVIAWGGDPTTLDWFERPHADAVAAAVNLLQRLGAIQDGKLTAIGRQMQRLPLHPRLARMLVAGGGARAIARACALLSERHFLAPRAATTTSDLLSAIDDWRHVPPHVDHVAREIETLAATLRERGVASESRAGGPGAQPPDLDDERFRRAVLAGYPDRVAERRQRGSPRVKLASGAGAVIAAESGVREAMFLVAVDVHASTRPNQPDSLVRVASAVERDWLTPTGSEVVHRVDAASGRVSAVRLDRYDAIVLGDRPAAVDPEIAARLLADAWRARGPSEADRRLLCRLRFARRGIDLDDAIATAARRARSLDDVDLGRALGPALLRELAREAPEAITAPSGRTLRLEYGDEGSVSASVKLQELFGVEDTPRIGSRREPLLLKLLAPNGRPVQVTRDLRSFWARTYPEVRKELRGRYPKHRWPEDPWKA